MACQWHHWFELQEVSCGLEMLEETKKLNNGLQLRIEGGGGGNTALAEHVALSFQLPDPSSH